jgi:hypothetical protein
MKNEKMRMENGKKGCRLKARGRGNEKWKVGGERAKAED